MPRDSAWFSFFDGKQLIPLVDQVMYNEDWLGLRKMSGDGKLAFEECPGFHMQIPIDWFDDMLERHLGLVNITATDQYNAPVRV